MELRRQQLRRGEPHPASLAPPSDNSVKGIDLMRLDQCEEIGETDAPVLAGATQATYVVSGGEVSLVNVPVPQEAKVVNEVVPVKRKRGRPPRSQAKTPQQPRVQPQPSPPLRKEDEEEDVCFICFDGGSLVLCDRRGCPKAYHPACVKRDEAFFQTKAKWNCGWHICSRCQKASSYMCYTCTFSVCKKCIKEENYVGVRGNMGFCANCMKTIMLIENINQDDEEMVQVQVDFDDKTSFEYLFKLYWLCLKEKLPLTIDELTKAKNPSRDVRNVTSKVESRYTPSNHIYSGAYSSDNSHVEVAVSGTKRRANEPPTSISKLDAKNPGNYQEMLPKGTNWATKELLEFVSYMKNGDTSVLSQFDVQELLLDYIKRKNLRDPQQKSQVICDLMLVKLFGKQRVAHFEMLKLLESHFLIQENSSNAKTMNGETIRAVPCQMEVDGFYNEAGSDRRQKTRKKANRSTNVIMDEIAAIDVHNVNLIYLRRKFLETLIDDINKVHEKLVGTIVRLRVSGSDLKLDIYRLVQVVGTCKAKESYQIGTKTTDIMLEVLNLDKREFISIDEISDQDLTEDECKRLRQSIKCGLNKRLTVGVVLEKSATLQAVRVSHVLEAEILKFNHLRDRASEKGHGKELRECIEKLEILKSPEERQRRMQEIPEIHTDPSLDPSLASAEDGDLATRKLDKHIKGQNSSLSRTWNKGDILNSLGNSAQKNIAGAFLRSRNVHTTFRADKDANSSDQEPTKDEDHEIWHYQDPTGKIQGPFSMSQLRRWKSSGHFPPYLRIWRTHEKQDQSVLLTDALEGQFHKASTSQNDTLPSRELRLAIKDTSPMGNDSQAESDKGINTLLKSTVAESASSKPSSHVVPVSVNNTNERQEESLAPCFGRSEGDNSFHSQPQVSCPQSSPAITGYATGNEARETLGSDRWNDVQTIGNHSSVKNVEDRTLDCSVSSNDSLRAPNLNQEIHVPDLSTFTPKSSPEDLETQAAETIQSLASSVLAKGASGVTWSTTATRVGVSGEQLPGVTPQDVMGAPSEKPAELTSDHVATQTQDNPQVAHSTGWPAIVADPDECDESVSDLLAEVEAMESMNGPHSSPTSTFHCDDDDDLTKGSDNDCFNPMAGVTLGPETCRSDASHANSFDDQNMSGRRNSPAVEAKENTKADDTPVNQCGAGPELHLFASSAPTSQDLMLTTTALRLGSEARESNLDAGGNPKIVSGLFSEPSPRSGQGSGHGNANVGAGHRSPRGSQQQRYSGSDRSTGHRDCGYGRERQWWNNSSSNSKNHSSRQWPYPTHPPKGLRICKFYESGYCKRGASCSFWHP